MSLTLKSFKDLPLHFANNSEILLIIVFSTCPYLDGGRNVVTIPINKNG